MIFASGFVEVDGVRQGPSRGAPAAGAKDDAAYIAGAAKRPAYYQPLLPGWEE